MTTTAEITARQIARSIGVAPRTRRFVLRDADGIAYDGRRYTHVLSAISRQNHSDLPDRARHVAFALNKSMSSGRMPVDSEARIAQYTPYRLCMLVARIARECPETTTGGMCDDWITPNHASL
jgi:hypothetical protein